MIILSIFIYMIYLRRENIKRINYRKLREHERQLKLYNKIQDFNEFKNNINKQEQTYRINNITLLRHGYYVSEVNVLYNKTFIS